MGAVNTTYTFTATDTVTSGKLNNIIDQTIMTDDAVFTGGTVEVAGGKLKVRAGSITSNELASSAVATGNIVDANVTTAKIANLNVTTEKIANLNVTTEKIAESNITTAKIANANITAAKLNGAQTGVAPIYGARAWCVFDATRNTSGAVSTTPSARLLIAKGNVSSVVRNSTGNFTVNFEADKPMPGSYAVIGGSYDTATIVNGFTYVTQSTSSFVISTENTNGAGQDYDINSLVVFG
jgi:hypothetical protein